MKSRIAPRGGERQSITIVLLESTADEILELLEKEVERRIDAGYDEWIKRDEWA